MEITLNLEVFEQKVNEYKKLVDQIRAVEPKVNVSNIVDQLDETERAIFDKFRDNLMKLDKQIHANYNSKLAQAFDAQVRVFQSDCKARTEYLVSTDKKASKVENDSERSEMIAKAEKLRENIDTIEDLLTQFGVAIPNTFYKHEDGKLYHTKAGNKVLDLPRVYKQAEDSTTVRGRPSKSMTLILGTVEEDGKVTWHDNDHVGKTFVDLFGSIRSEYNPPGLFKVVEKSGQSAPSGWDTPVEYAGRNWVAKVRK